MSNLDPNSSEQAVLLVDGSGNVVGTVTNPLEVSGLSLSTTPFRKTKADAGILWSAGDYNISIPTSGNLRRLWLLRVPSAATISARVKCINLLQEVGGVGDVVRWSFWRNPTFTSDGTLITPRNLKFDLATAPQAILSKLPTLTDFGELFRIRGTQRGGVEAFMNFDFSLVIPPGQSLLIVGDALVSAVTGAMSIEWLEEA